MLLDDEFDIVTIFTRGLRKNGFTVFGFSDPLIALEHFKVNSQSYRLVVTDVRMPKMNGFEFASNVREINPKVKIVLMSAFELSDVEYSAALHSLKIDGFLRKPVEIPTLIKEVRDTVTG
ncbi:MAG: response regulator [Nitrososphaera sp.]